MTEVNDKTVESHNPWMTWDASGFRNGGSGVSFEGKVVESIVLDFQTKKSAYVHSV